MLKPAFSFLKFLFQGVYIYIYRVHSLSQEFVFTDSSFQPARIHFVEFHSVEFHGLVSGFLDTFVRW